MIFTLDYLPDFTVKVSPLMVGAGGAVLEPEIKSAFLDSLVKAPDGGFKYSTGYTVLALTRSHVFFENNATRFKSNIFFKRPGAFGDGRGSDNPAWRASMVNRKTGFVNKALSRKRQQIIVAMEQAFYNELGKIQ